MKNSIEYELEKCRRSAQEGYELASEKYNDIKQTLIEAANTLQKTDVEQNRVKRIQNTNLVEKQKQELRRLTDAVKPIKDDLEDLRRRSKDFSIVVYGRTMAGKSTLMEILTHGNGSSIGKGSQRTTLDVRDYYWNGLKITDVPGISAFGGEADERLALEAAKAADLIIFLLTSDAPQADEAEKLAQLRSLGKPVLGIINVKMSFNINDDLDIEDLQDRLADTQTINTTIQQFKKFSDKHNQDWSGIKFVATHLLSAYQSQNKNPKVFEISRFTEVEDFILEKVRNDGRFLRIKTFADAVAVPMSNIILKIYEQSAKTLLESDIWFNKRKQLDEWSQNFLERSQQRVDNIYEQLSQELNNAIYNFAESHYEDEKAGEHWQQTFANLNFDKKYENLLKSLAGECDRKRKELSDELTQELSYAFRGTTNLNIELEGTTPWGQYLSTAIGVIGFAFPPLRIASVIISLIGNWLSDGKAKKIREAKNNLRESLTNPSFEILEKMHNQVISAFNNEILHKGVDGFRDSLADYQFMLARLGKSQSDMAGTLYQKFFDLNFELLKEAIEYKNAGYGGGISNIARIPGEIMLVLSDNYNVNDEELSDLLGETVTFVRYKEKFHDTVQMILKRDFATDAYPLDFTKNNQDAEKALAVILEDKVSERDFKLAQQIATAPIIKKYNSASSYSVNSQSAVPNTNYGNNYGNNYGRNQFENDFKKIEDMINNPKGKNINEALSDLKRKIIQQRDAAAMKKLADYFNKIAQYRAAKRCLEMAEEFQR